MPRNVDADEGSSSSPSISIFNYPGRVSGKCKTYFLDQVDLYVAHLYVLQNCLEVEPYLETYDFNTFITLIDILMILCCVI